jgi:parallel beta-helix repeat protein
MKRPSTLTSLSLAGLLALGAAACSDHPQPLAPDGAQPLAAGGGANVVQVAPPTGNHTTDRANIMAAFAQVQPGGTVQFQHGTYLIGSQVPFSWDDIVVSVPRITLRGHPGGTTLQGCTAVETPWPWGACTGLVLNGGHQTVRNLTFANMEYAIVLGIGNTQVGGYLVESNTFRDTYDGVVGVGDWPQPAVIRNNRFINLGFAIFTFGRTYHVFDNDMSAPQPELIPFGTAVTGLRAVASPDWSGPCDHNVIARNRIDGYNYGIEVLTGAYSCSHNVIRDNTIRATGVFPWTYGSGVELGDYSDEGNFLQHNLIQGNQVLGAKGMGILVQASRNRVVNNTISDVALFEDFGLAEGILVFGHDNQIVANTFANIPNFTTMLWSNHNHVGTISPSERVWIWEQTVGNRVTGPGTVVFGPNLPFAAGAESTEAAPAATPVIPDRAALRKLRQRERAEAAMERLAPLLQRVAPR